jgi:DNA-binding transcriptional regulator YhcF (GntR family)
VEKISETDSTSVETKTGENDPSRVTEFQDRKEIWLSTVEISKNLALEVQTQTTGELPFIQDFRNNDNKILSLLNQHTGSYYSFKGLMRKLNLHQQSLARALNRLEELGLIQRSVNGYKLNKNEQTSAKGMAMPDKRKRSEYKQLLQSYIPTGIKTEEIVQALNGRWFSRIRWIGLMESEIGYTLQWINEDDTFQINLRIIWDHLIIETNALSDDDKIEAMVGSFKIFEQITKLLQTRLHDHHVKALDSVRFVA